MAPGRAGHQRQDYLFNHDADRDGRLIPWVLSLAPHAVAIGADTAPKKADFLSNVTSRARDHVPVAKATF